MGRRISLVTWLCWLVIFSEGYDIGVMGAVLPGLMKDPTWHLSPVLAGALASAALCGMFVGGFLVGALSDTYGRRRCLLGCITLFSVSMLGAAFAGTPLLFALFRFASGIGIGGAIPVAAALTTEFAPAGRRNREFALMYSGYSLGIFAAAMASYAFLQALGWRAVVAFGGLPLLLVPVLAILLPESVAYLAAHGRLADAEKTARRFGIAVPFAGQHHEPARSVIGSLVALFDPSVRRATIGFALTFIASMVLVFGLNTWLPEIMRSAGYDLGPSILFLGVFALSSAIGGILLGAIADRIGRRPTIAGAFFAGVLAILALAWPGPLLLTYALVAVAGIGTVAAAVLLTSYVSAFYPPNLKATAVGFCGSVSRSGAVAGPMLGGIIAAQKLPFAYNFIIFGLIGLIAAVCIFIVPAKSTDMVAEGALAIA